MPQDVIEGSESFSYQILDDLPLDINVTRALDVLEKNELKGSIYRELKKRILKHIKKQSKVLKE